ncbi:chromosome partitioning protein ParA [Microcoleus sp. Pol1C5]|uniref:chromosome partitioning protein ParA n=1 Tax=Microcoleus sp. Pol1C5 TaxID=3055406 RepID=UPI002FCFD0BD
MHRSGSSLTASLLQSAGLHIGRKLLGADSVNIKGHFENIDFYEFHRGVLRSQAIMEDGWTLQGKINVEDRFVEQAKEIVAKNSVSRVWGWKEPRTTLFLDFWSDLLPEAKFLLIYRSPWEVVDSLYRRGDPTFQEHPELALKVWHQYNQIIRDFYDHFSNRCLLANINTIVNFKESYIKAINQKFKTNLTAPESTVYDPSLFHAQPLDSYRPSLVNHYCPEAVEMYQELDARAWWPDEKPNFSWRELIKPVYKAEAFQEWVNTSNQERENKALRVQLQNFQSQLHQTQGELEHSQTQLHQIQGELERSQTQLHQTQEKFAYSKSQLHQTQGELHQTQGELHQTQVEFKRSQSQLHQTQRELEHSQNQLHQTQEELENSQTQLHQTQEEFAYLKSQLHQTQGELHQTQVEFKRSQSQLHQTQRELENSQTQLHQTQAELENSQTQLHQTQAELENSQTQLHQTQTELKRSQSQLDQTQEELAQSHSQVYQSQRELEQSQIQLHQSEALLEQSQAQLHQSEALLEQSQAQLHQKQEEWNRLQTQLYQIQEKLEQSQTQQHQIQAKVQQFQMQLHQTEEQLKQSQTQLHQTQEQLQQSQTQLHQTQEQLQQSEIQLHQTQGELELSQFQQALGNDKDGQDQMQYKLLVWEACRAYHNKALTKMQECLQQSLKYTPFSGTQTVNDWLESFAKFSSEKGCELDTYSLTNSEEWKQLMGRAVRVKPILGTSRFVGQT